MDARFDNYFQSRVAELWESQVSREGVVPSGANPYYVARLAVQRASRQDRPLRGDAQLLLYLALSELVARPVLNFQGTTPHDLTTAIDSDVDLITARAGAETPAEEPITAHRIVTATSQVWDNLRTGQFGIWG